MSSNFAPKIIDKGLIRLEPLESASIEEICAAMIPDPDGWYSVMFGLNHRDAYLSEMKDAADYRAQRTGIGFVIRDRVTSEVAGISFFLKMDEENRSIEIGTTNIAPRFRRTHVNTALKLALLEEAFETLKCIRVAFRVDEENVISQRAIERLGAIRGGLLRHERILPDGRIRNYVFYSIIADEWPEVKARLTQRLGALPTPAQP